LLRMHEYPFPLLLYLALTDKRGHTDTNNGSAYHPFAVFLVNFALSHHGRWTWVRKLLITP
jgi:hypothetical protein